MATPMNQKEKFCKDDGLEKVDEAHFRLPNVLGYNKAGYIVYSKYFVKVHALCKWVAPKGS